MDSRWLSLAEIAGSLGVSEDSVYRWFEEHDTPAHKVGRRSNIKIQVVDSSLRDEAGIALPQQMNPAAKAFSRLQ
jgi:excisionase family DNA binding protein